MKRSAVAFVALAVGFALLDTGAVSSAASATCGDPANTPCTSWASRVPTGPANEIHVAVNPLDPLHFLVVAKDYSIGPSTACGSRHVGSASYVTTDGGRTWSVARVPAPYPNGFAEPSPLPYRCGTDPVAMFGPDGTAYYLVLNYQTSGGSGAAIAVARSPDGGVTWPASDIRVVHVSGGDDKEWGTIDRQGRFHLIWVDFSTGGITYVRGSTATFTFEPPKILGFYGSGNPAANVGAGPGNEVYVTWRDGTAIKYRRSLDGGDTFEPTKTALTVFPFDAGGAPRFPFMPQLAVDDQPSSPNAGRIHLVWPDRRQGSSGVFASSSGDGGDTWTTPVRVDDDADNRRQVMPHVSVAPSGRVDVVWLGERPLGVNTTLVTGLTFGAYGASSYDGGVTWSDARQMLDLPLVANHSLHQSGFVFIGDYIGAASTNDALWGAYPGEGADRLAEGLAPPSFQRSDAYLASLPAAGAVAPAPARGAVQSVPAPVAVPGPMDRLR